MVVLFLIFSGTTIHFSHGGQHCLTFPSAAPKNSDFSTSSCFPPPSVVVILMGVRWYLIVVLIYISQIINNIQHLFMYLLAICLSFLEKYSKFSAHFKKLGSLNFCNWVEGVLYICCILTPYWLQPWNEKTLAPWKKSYDQPRQHIKKQRHYFANKGPSSQSYGFSSSDVWMWELDYKESWVPKNRCFWTVVLKTL